MGLFTYILSDFLEFWLCLFLKLVVFFCYYILSKPSQMVFTFREYAEIMGFVMETPNLLQENIKLVYHKCALVLLGRYNSWSTTKSRRSRNDNDKDLVDMATEKPTTSVRILRSIYLSYTTCTSTSDNWHMTRGFSFVGKCCIIINQDPSIFYNKL